GDVVATDEVTDDGSWTVQIDRPEREPQGGSSAGGTVGPAGGSATMGIAARGLAQVFAERDDDDGDDGDDGDDRDDGDDGDGSAEGYYFTLTQTVPEGVSEAYAGESEPYRAGPYTWVEPINIVYPTDGATVDLESCLLGRHCMTVGYSADESQDVQVLSDDEAASPAFRVLPCLPEGLCDGDEGAEHTVDLGDIDHGWHRLTLQYVDDDGDVL